MLASLLIAALLALGIVAGWALLSRRQASGSRRLDGWARVGGSCGSTLEIGLGIRNGRVAHTLCRADGCGYNCTCLNAAARLARGRTLDALFDIDADAILRTVGDVPEDHRHCAHLAAHTLHAASRDCLEKRRATGFEAAPLKSEGRDREEDA